MLPFWKKSTRVLPMRAVPNNREIFGAIQFSTCTPALHIRKEISQDACADQKAPRGS